MVTLNSTPAGMVNGPRMFGKMGAPAWLGERLMLIWARSEGLVVLFAESSGWL
jgi:hypothetical protein